MVCVCKEERERKQERKEEIYGYIRIRGGSRNGKKLNIKKGKNLPPAPRAVDGGASGG